MKPACARGCKVAWLSLPAAALPCALVVALLASPERAPSSRSPRSAAPAEPVVQARPGEPAVTPREASVARSVPRRTDQIWLEEVRALVSENRIALARDRARSFAEAQPDSPLAAEALRLTGAHPHP